MSPTILFVFILTPITPGTTVVSRDVWGACGGCCAPRYPGFYMFLPTATCVKFDLLCDILRTKFMEEDSRTAQPNLGRNQPQPVVWELT